MPRVFKFNLQKVLDYRERLEDEAKQAFADAQAKIFAQNQFLDKLQHQLAEHEQASVAQKTQTAAEMMLYRDYKERLLQEVAQAVNRLAELEQHCETCRVDLVIRSKDRKLLEKLKENQAKRHARDLAHAEQSEFDEMATVRYRPKDI
ncbi:flagellar export protein FliJ [Desulfovibrio inopinatus]|uniref:flagellar export protein FliJ n=1 Tax=Desulfovibrio inopinatus TaxID=102109 RepID=UPI00040C8543|nr:flagellar export protein FliJ [Desulfovibrio inopinatus]